MSIWDVAHGASFAIPRRLLNLQSFSGTVRVGMVPEVLVKELPGTFSATWVHTPTEVVASLNESFGPVWEECGEFGTLGESCFFPLWYPALIFALAGVGVLRFRRQFSIRSALVAVSVVAALLGVAVTM